MNLLELTRLGTHHVRNAVAEEVYLRTGHDATIPVSIYGEVIERCNYKCRYCDYWRRPNYRDEMSIEEWQKALLDLKDFIGHYHIEFSGGEPYIKKGFVDLITFCGEQGLKWGVTTNGGAFGNEKVVDWTVKAKPFNINISIDSRDADVHNYSRGIEGSLDDILAGIRSLTRAKAKHGADFPIIIKAVVHKLNFRLLPDMVNWVRDIGATAINFQPVEQVTDEAKDEFWIGPDDLDELIKVKDRLLEMKRAGRPDPELGSAAQSVAEPFPPREGAARGDAVPHRHAQFLHPLRRPGRNVLELPADRQCPHPDRPRNLVRQGRHRAAQGDGGLRDAVPVHLSVAEEPQRQIQDGHEAVTQAGGVTASLGSIPGTRRGPSLGHQEAPAAAQFRLCRQ